MFIVLADGCVERVNGTNRYSLFMPLTYLEANKDKNICNEKFKNEYK